MWLRKGNIQEKILEILTSDADKNKLDKRIVSHFVNNVKSIMDIAKEREAKVIQKYSSMAKFDLTELYLRLIFSFVVGNSDMHLKNFSLIEKTEGSSEYVLSAAYDLLPVNAIMPEDEEEFALTLFKKKRKIKRKDFLLFAGEIGIEQKSAEKMIAKVVKVRDNFIAMCEESYLSAAVKERLIKLIENRVEALK